MHQLKSEIAFQYNLHDTLLFSSCRFIIIKQSSFKVGAITQCVCAEAKNDSLFNQADLEVAVNWALCL